MMRGDGIIINSLVWFNLIHHFGLNVGRLQFMGDWTRDEMQKLRIMFQKPENQGDSLKISTNK